MPSAVWQSLGNLLSPPGNPRRPWAAQDGPFYSRAAAPGTRTPPFYSRATPFYSRTAAPGSGPPPFYSRAVPLYSRAAATGSASGPLTTANAPREPQDGPGRTPDGLRSPGRSKTASGNPADGRESCRRSRGRPRKAPRRPRKTPRDPQDPGPPRDGPSECPVLSGRVWEIF